MNYLRFDVLPENHYKEDVWQLLCKYDDSFIPSLSSRQSTLQTDLTRDVKEILQPHIYFQNILKQSIFLAVDEHDKAIGFMSYKPSFISEDLQDNVDTVYITTIIVDEAYRGRGITSKFYALIEQIGEKLRKPIMTRTWSTNTAHIHVLEKKGLKEIKRLTNARGNNIDTVYYRKHLGG